MRYEMSKEHQAQLDLKENIEFRLDSGEIININYFTFYNVKY